MRLKWTAFGETASKRACKTLFTLFFWVAAVTYVQCFVLCLREEGPRAVTALYFGWPAFRNRHFVIWGGGVAWGGGGGQQHTETQRGRLRTACGQRRMDSKNSQTTPAPTSTSSIRQLLGAADAQTAHHATSSTAPTHQLLGSANAETTPAGAPAAAADRKQRPDATCEGKNG